MAVDISKIKDRSISSALDGALNTLPSAVYAAATNTSGFTATAVQVAGARDIVVLDLTGALGAGANITTPTAAAIVAKYPAPVANDCYILRIINNSSGAFSWTVVGGTGVTVNGTATVAQHTTRDFTVTLATVTAGSEAVTIQNVGSATN